MEQNTSKDLEFMFEAMFGILSYSLFLVNYSLKKATLHPHPPKKSLQPENLLKILLRKYCKLYLTSYKFYKPPFKYLFLRRSTVIWIQLTFPAPLLTIAPLCIQLLNSIMLFLLTYTPSYTLLPL